MEYTWTISSLKCKVQEGELTDVVQTIHWRYTATKTIPGVNNKPDTIYSAESYGSSNVGSPTLENFTDYNNLTKEQIVGWLENIIDVDDMQSRLAEEINSKITPVTITLPPPF